jgi:hypothetical protein
MTRLTRETTLLQLLIELSDGKGHCNRELTEKSTFYDTRISELFGDLETRGIIYRRNRRSTNPRNKPGSRYDEKPYFIGPETSESNPIAIFEYIFREIVLKCESDLRKKFLESEYINDLVKKVGLIPIYNILKPYIQEDPFKKLVSRAIFNHQAVAEEFNNQIELLKDDSNLMHGLYITPLQGENNILAILEKFDLLAAVEFYRNIIGDGYSILYREIAPNYFINEALAKFTDYDVHLSPFTSFPRNNPANLLFEIPYERIYNDAYILDKEDREKFIKRAYIVYSHFAEMLFEGCIRDMRLNEIEYINFKYLEHEKYLRNMDDDFDYPLGNEDDIKAKQSRENYLENILDNIQTTIKLAIYHWNIASSRFDQLIAALGQGKYHIRSNNNGIQIIDLEGGEPSIVVFGNISLLPGPINPFETLWPCSAFKKLNLESKEITYNDILSYIESNLNPKYNPTREE